MPFELPALPYAYDALQPFMSKETLEYHHDKHHETYVETANKLIQGSGLEHKSLEEVVKATYRAPDRKALFNNAAQHWNHLEFWRCMKPGGGRAVPGEIERRIEADLGGIDKFKADFVAQGLAQFGSGWVWLVLDNGKLEILTTSNGDNPPALGKTALLACDVWEHSYYIDYRNRRADFLKAFLDHLVNWDYVAELYAKANSRRAAA